MTPSPLPDEGGIWYTLWTLTKMLFVLLIVGVIAILMLTSSQPTVTPSAAAMEGTSTAPPGTPTPGPTATSIPIPTQPPDAVVPFHLIYVQGSTLYKLHGIDPPQELAPGPGVHEPAVAPDGTHLAYVRFQKNYQDLFVLNLLTGKSTQIVNDAPNVAIDPRTGLTVGSPTWSPDGTMLYFSWNYPGMQAGGNQTDFRIFRCTVATTCDANSAAALSDPNVTIQAGGNFEPVFRPGDPNTLIYTKYGYQTQGADSRALGQIVAHDLTTGVETSLTPLDATSQQQFSLSQPTWSPTGKFLAFVRTTADAQQSSIYVTAFHAPGDPQDYAHAKLLVQGAPFAAYPVFSPNGKYLAYIASGADGRLHLYIAHVYVGKQARLTHVEMVKRVNIVDGDRLAWTP